MLSDGKSIDVEAEDEQTRVLWSRRLGAVRALMPFLDYHRRHNTLPSLPQTLREEAARIEALEREARAKSQRVSRDRQLAERNRATARAIRDKYKINEERE
jgi:hypothetical protein